MKRKSKKIVRALAIFLCLAIFVGCGSQTEGDTAQSGTSLSADGESAGTSSAETASSASQGADTGELLSANGGTDSTPEWAGTQYYQGEAITLWRKRNGSEDFEKAIDIYVKDSKNFTKLVVSGASSDYTDTWFLTKEGYCFAIYENTLARIEADGKETFKATVGGGVHDICQLEDGRIMIVMQEASGNYRLAELSVEDGSFTILEALDFGRDKRIYITAKEEGGLLLLRSTGFWDVNLETGELTEVMPMSEYDFKLPYTVKDFRLLEGASVELLYKESSEVKLPKDIQKYREVVTIQTRFVDRWLQAMLNDFNATNYTYYAVLEPTMDFSNYSVATVNDFLESVEEAFEGGGGPDLIDVNCMNSSLFVEKGYLENLTPYMEAAGVDPMDYFPVTFEHNKRGDNIYVANLYIEMSGLRMKKDVLGGREIANAEDLADALLGYPSPAILNEKWPSQMVLFYLLAGSEDLWGIIDWDKGTCNFHDDFFAKALEVSQLFGDDGSGLPAVADLYNSGAFYNYINKEQLELAGEVYLGFLFDEGCHPWMLTGQTLSMNSNSDCKEGAWAVIEYLLSEEAQTQKWLTAENGERLEYREYPVNVYAFEAVLLLEQEETSLLEYDLNGDSHVVYKVGQPALRNLNWDKEAYRALYDLTEADMEEIRDLLYEVCYMPGKPAEILDIVYEEAAKYFAGERSLGDTCEAVQTRAQAYLDGLKN